MPADPPWTIQKPHIDLYLIHQKKHLGDDCLFQSLFAELKGYYSDHRAIYTDGSKTENRVAAAAISDGLSAQVRLTGNASIFTAELQALKWLLILLKIVMRIVLLYFVTLYLVFKLLITTTVIILLFRIFYLFIYLGFYVAFNTVQVISRRVVGRAEETSTYSSLGLCTVNCRPTASNYQLSHLRPSRGSNPSLRGGRRECYHSATVAPFRIF